MKSLTHHQCARTRLPGFLATTALLIATSVSLHATLPTPLVKLRFNDGSGTTATNVGSLGGSAVFVQNGSVPEFTNLVASGIFTPGANTGSVDFGDLGASHGAEQVNLTTDLSVVPDGTLGTNISASFTLCGWVNARSLTTGYGGNRLLCALPSAWGSGGFDLVYNGDGSLQFAINTFSDDGGVKSSSGKITASATLDSANWVFFAVTFDPSLANNNVKFYFGNSTNLSTLDSQFNYKSGQSVYTPSTLTVGNVGPGTWFWNDTGVSRALRGAIDEVQVYGTALSLAQVQEAQTGGAAPLVPATITAQPSNLTVFEGQPATFSVGTSGSGPMTFQWQTNGVNVTDATNSSITFSSTTTNMSGTVLRVSVANPVTSAFWSSNATLTVLPENGLKFFSSLSGNPANDAGNLLGNGIFTVVDGYPATSTKVPTGAFAPSNNVGSVDFGVFTNYATQSGGRAINYTNFVGNGNTMGPMTAFTICGWVNCASPDMGSGGNRIAYSLNGQNYGFDLVVATNGIDANAFLKLGVNEWPDNTPAISSSSITIDPSESASNWVFFAVSYDGSLTSQNISFYFGNGTQAAALNWTTDYNKGPIQQSGILGIGNANQNIWFAGGQGTMGDVRSFRGLIDEVKVYNRVLTLEEIQAAQIAPAVGVVASPTLNAKLQGNQIALSWVSAASFQLQSRTSLTSGSWSNVGTAPTINGTTNTVQLPTTSPAQFFRLSQ